MQNATNLITDGRVLVLDASYSPVGVIGWERAVALLLTGAAEAVVDSERIISSPSVSVIVPAVVRVARASFSFRRNYTMARKRAIHERDKWTCAYCGVKAKGTERSSVTIDHIYPKSRGGSLTEPINLITACKPCNNIKDDRTPEEAGMKRRFPAREFTWQERTDNRFSARRDIPESWKPYLAVAS
jgi:5-methylcytosine-specific restriction endonuclease McrA